jgi:hypothetical protein
MTRFRTPLGGNVLPAKKKFLPQELNIGKAAKDKNK